MREGLKPHPFRVLVVDSSAVVRQGLRELLQADPDFEIIGITSDPFGAARRMGDVIPDVIILDTETRRMDGLSFLRRLMAQHPIPVIMSIPDGFEADEIARKAYAAGAVDILFKNGSNVGLYLQQHAEEISQKIKEAANLKAEALSEKLRTLQMHNIHKEKLTADVMLPPLGKSAHPMEKTETIICFGASTGGTEAITDVLRMLPADAPAIVIVQHMPAKFTYAFARRLNDLCAIEVREAADGDVARSGLALIAPGGHHLLLQRTQMKYRVAVRDGPPVARHKPSVDVLFRSAAHVAGPNAIGVLLTGMGDDGARGMAELKDSGALTIAQNESSSVVFGMPKEAISRGAACKIVPLDKIAQELIRTRC